jgi:enoyl-CoA hydratase
VAGVIEVVLACDISMAAQNTKFEEPEDRFETEIFTMLLPWITSPKQAKEIFLIRED